MTSSAWKIAMAAYPSNSRKNSPRALTLILAGGSGTRFWPLSQRNKPKQFLSLLGERSLLSETGDRARLLSDDNDVYVCGLEAHAQELKEHLPWVSHWALEPEGRNTAAAVALGVARMLADGHSPEMPLVVLPADHAVPDPKAFEKSLQFAIGAAVETKGLITLGIHPRSPHTGYGYIRAGRKRDGESAIKVERFVEKPQLAEAERLIASGDCYWNSGMFAWRLDAIRSAFERFAPALWNALSPSPKGTELRAIYPKVEKAPIDKAILEKADNVFVVPTAMSWSDVGSWGALAELLQDSPRDNIATHGDPRFIDSQGCLVRAPGLKVGIVGCRDLIVVREGDSLLVVSRSDDQKVRELVDAWQEKNR